MLASSTLRRSRTVLASITGVVRSGTAGEQLELGGVDVGLALHQDCPYGEGV